MKSPLTLLIALLCLISGCQNAAPGAGKQPTPEAAAPTDLEYISQEYRQPSSQPGTLEELTYSTYESFSYQERSQPLSKRAWVYLPYGYSTNRQYNVFYLSHGGWSNEDTWLGTAAAPATFKHVLDNAIAAGQIEPLIVVCPTYNNTSPQDSSDYELALQLTENFHQELLNDLLPAVESRYATYASGTSPEELIASRDHRGFGGFSMGSVNTWQTFRHGLDYFRFFAPSSGALTTDGAVLAQAVTDQNRGPEEFFIYAASGTNDFAHPAFKAQIEAMAATESFTLTDEDPTGNLTYREREGYAHDSWAAEEYVYNALRVFWRQPD